MSGGKRNGARQLKLEHQRGQRLQYLVGCILEALQAYDADDGNNKLVVAGISAELKEIESDYEKGNLIE
jgi:hypothetical protein